MGDNDISVESVEVALLSEIEMSSALMMKDAYQPDSGEKMDEDREVPGLQTKDSPQEDGSVGPNAVVYITKLSHRTPPEEINKILLKKPDRTTNMGTHDFYTMVITLSMRLGDRSTTRFLNGTIELAFPSGIKILTYSPKEKGIISAIIENGGDALSLSAGLDFSGVTTQGTKILPDPKENRFRITVGPGEKISGTYRRNSGFRLDIPAYILLEYQGMLKNERELFLEIFPPIPGPTIEISGNEMLAVISFIVRAPKNTLPKITARIEGRVKGNLWGVVPLKGSVVF
jgi:hypothetical protein